MPAPAHPRHDAHVFPEHRDRKANPVNPLNAPNAVFSSLYFMFSITYRSIRTGVKTGAALYTEPFFPVKFFSV